MSTRTITATELDIRVRERNLRTGVVTEKEVEKHISALPDLDAHVDAFVTPQPALDPPPVAEEEEDEPGSEA